jgi:hypothetical protein
MHIGYIVRESGDRVVSDHDGYTIFREGVQFFYLSLHGRGDPAHNFLVISQVIARAYVALIFAQCKSGTSLEKMGDRVVSDHVG